MVSWPGCSAAAQAGPEQQSSSPQLCKQKHLHTAVKEVPQLQSLLIVLFCCEVCFFAGSAPWAGSV